MKRVLLCAALIAWSGLASAVVYKWVDAQGKTQYGDRPPDGVRAEVVEMAGVHQGRYTPARLPAASSATTPNSATAPAASADAVQKQVDDDVSKTREKQCADAQDRYKKLIEGRRLFKTGTDGERQYLNSDEIDSERINAKRDVDLICNSST